MDDGARRLYRRLCFSGVGEGTRIFREVMQVAEDRYLKGWYGHLKGGWRSQGKKVGSAPYIRDEDEKLLRKLEEIRERCRQYFASLLNTTSAALDQTIIEGLSPKPEVDLSVEKPYVVDKPKQALRSMAHGKAMGSDDLPVKQLKLGLSDSSHEIFLGITVAVWMTGEVP